MFGRIVSLGNLEVMVHCVPETPMHEVLRMAAEIVRRRGFDNDREAR